jgi:hypothetical protein
VDQSGLFVERPLGTIIVYFFKEYMSRLLIPVFTPENPVTKRQQKSDFGGLGLKPADIKHATDTAINYQIGNHLTRGRFKGDVSVLTTKNNYRQPGTFSILRGPDSPPIAFGIYRYPMQIVSMHLLGHDHRGIGFTGAADSQNADGLGDGFEGERKSSADI